MERPTTIALLACLATLPVQAGAPDAILEARCIDASARLNRIPASVLRAIRLQEGGRIGGWHWNADDSVDYGVMQINSRWLQVLAPRGYTAAALTYNACASIAAGAWIIAQSLATASVWNRSDADGLAYWRAIGNYHSHTPGLNRAYAAQVWQRYRNAMPTGGRP